METSANVRQMGFFFIRWEIFHLGSIVKGGGLREDEIQLLCYLHTSYVTSENKRSILTFSNSRKKNTPTSLAHPSLPLSNWLEIQIHFHRHHPPRAGNGETKPGTGRVRWGGCKREALPRPTPALITCTHTHTHNQPTQADAAGFRGGGAAGGAHRAIKTAAYARPLVPPPSYKSTEKKNPGEHLQAHTRPHSPSGLTAAFHWFHAHLCKELGGVGLAPEGGGDQMGAA